jgi:hypothetical protein
MRSPTEPRTAHLVKECLRQYEACRHTAAALYIWQKYARFWRATFLILPIILGGFAGSQVLGQSAGEPGKIAAAFCSVLAGFFPAIFKALNLDMHVTSIGQSATEFTNLRDRFRQAAHVKSLEPFETFQAEFEGLMDRMDAVRMAAPPAPEWCFLHARKKISKGDYDATVDRLAST